MMTDGTVLRASDRAPAWLRPLGRGTQDSSCRRSAPAAGRSAACRRTSAAGRRRRRGRRHGAAHPRRADHLPRHVERLQRRRERTAHRQALAEAGGLPAGFVLATKVDPGADGSFDAARVRQSFEESLQRLGLDRIQLLFLHDPEFAITFDEAMAPHGAVAELVRLKEEGLAGVIGVAGGDVAMMRQFVETGAFDVLLTHSRYSLVDRSADETITTARSEASPSSTPPSSAAASSPSARRGRRATATARHRRTRWRRSRRSRVCRAHDVPLAAAAIQFSLRDERISSTLVGFSRPERVDETVRLAEWPIPDELWTEVERYVPAPDNWLW